MFRSPVYSTLQLTTCRSRIKAVSSMSRVLAARFVLAMLHSWRLLNPLKETIVFDAATLTPRNCVAQVDPRMAAGISSKVHTAVPKSSIQRLAALVPCTLSRQATLLTKRRKVASPLLTKLPTTKRMLHLRHLLLCKIVETKRETQNAMSFF